MRVSASRAQVIQYRTVSYRPERCQDLTPQRKSIEFEVGSLAAGQVFDVLRYESSLSLFHGSVSHKPHHLARFEVLEARPAQIRIGAVQLIVAVWEDPPLNRDAEVGLVLL